MTADPNLPSDDLDQLKRALAALKKARARIAALEQARSEPIAIIGIGCRLPGGINTPQAFWQFLKNGQSAMVPTPPERWEASDFLASGPDEPGKMQSALGGFLKDVDQFDPHFFGISPREANAMDPQQRLALEAAWEALEDAGIVPGELAGSPTGVFIGIGLNDYADLQIPAQAADPTLIDNYFIQGNALCITANRISYALDLQGPSMAIDTACSSSLVAIHTACQSLRNGDCSLVLVGGSNLMLSPAIPIGLGKFLAPDGLCKTFDSRANGYTRGEGSILFVLKRLSEAVAANDRIYAVIRGSAINQDGFSSGLTVPNGAAQEAMLRAALDNAGVAPGEIDYVEAHGTGTALGDPIEANALGAVFAPGRSAGQELLIGSVKTNIGHLEAGAGIAGMLKVVLGLVHGQIPPSLNYLQPNPMIDFEGLRLRVVTELTPWPRRDHPARAGVSSFGFGGANSHAILEAAPALETVTPEEENGPYLFTLSAKTAPALNDAARRLAEFLNANPGLPAAQVRHTLNRRRSRFSHRLAVAARDLPGLAENLAAFAEGQPAPHLVHGQVRRERPKIAFLFTGQGAQYTGMGKELYRTQPVFRAALDACEAIFQRETGESLLAILYPEAESPESTGKIDYTRYTQPALFALEYALAALWRAWGIEPSAVIGHSIGEYVAACVAGAVSLEDGLKLVIARGCLMGDLPEGGAMAGVFAPLEQVQQAIASASQVSVAAVNAPDSTVISGDAGEVQEILDRLAAEGVKARRLVVSHAFHSPLMDPILDEFERAAAACRFSAPRIPLISNASGWVFGPGEAPDAAYWRRHARGAVQFAAGMQTLHELGIEVFLECGPNPVLIGLGKRCLPDETNLWLPSLRQGQPEPAHLLKSLGALYCLGLEIDWTALEGETAYPPLSLPTYPFQHERYWFTTRNSYQGGRTTPASERPLLGQRLRSPGLAGPTFATQIERETLGYLWDHCAYQNAIFPASGYIDMALSATDALHPGEPVVLEDLLIQNSLPLPEDGSVPAQIVLTPGAEGEQTAKIYSSRGEEDWQLHAYAQIGSAPAALEPTLSLADTQAACPDAIDPDTFYSTLDQIGMQYGPAFRNIHALWSGPGQALAHVQLPDSLSPAGYRIHPALLDACFQAVGVGLSGSSETFLPIGFDRIHLLSQAPTELWCHARITPGETGESLRGDLTLYRPDGQIAGQVSGMRLKRISRSLARRMTGTADLSNWLYRLEWQPQPRPAATTGPLPAHWLVLGDQAPATALAGLIDGSHLALPGSTLEHSGPQRWSYDPTRPEDVRQLLAETHPEGVVYLSADLQTGLHVLQAACAQAAPPQVWLATPGSQAVLSRAGAEDVSVEGAGLWGLARTTRVEYPDLALRCVDLDPASLPENNARLLWSEIQAQSGEDEVAYRNEERFVQRLARWTATAEEAPARLEITARGSLDNLALRPMQRRAPGPGQVEMRVRATGVNFRDVLNTLDMYPGEAGGLGHECSGVVTAVGAGVTHVQPGDAVLALANDSFASYTLARGEFVVRKPVEMSFEEAATIPITFLTAAYALEHLAGMQAGDRVLIHAAAGGVGLAAVQLAQQAGAEIYATAGSPEKRALLRSLGVPHVMDSRTLDFADEILGQTVGAGIDIVLNSLADEFIPRSLAALRPGGRFVEIGKRGIWSPEQVAALGKDIQYHILYLGDVCDREPARVGELLRDLTARFETDALRPLPWRAFPLAQASQAFRFMAQAKHVGKIVLTQAPAPAQAVSVRTDASYLITGGLGGLGLTAARKLAEAGAGHIILVGRRAPSAAAQQVMAEIQTRAGERVCLVALQADLAQRAEVERVLEIVSQEHPPLAGIVHAAGVLDDGVLEQQSWERFSGVAAPKWTAAWHLHQLTTHLALDFFVLFSAGAGWLGSPGQSGYAAANTALDALAHYRRARGLPAVSIAWGPWAEVGMAARMKAADRERLSRQGLGEIYPDEGERIFDRLLGESGAVAALPVDWSQFAAAHPHLPPRFKDLAVQVRGSAPGQKAATTAHDILERLAAAPPNKRRSLLQAHAREQALHVLGLSAGAAIDPQQPLREMGMDSLMAVELRNALSASLKHKLPATLLFDFPTLEALSGCLLRELWPAESSTNPAPVPTSAPAATGLEDLSDEEAEALLLAELEQSNRKDRKPAHDV